MTHDEPLLLKTLAEFTGTLLTSYDVDTVLSELTTRLNQVLGLAGSGVTLARDGRLECVSAEPSAILALERQQTETQSGPCVSAWRDCTVVTVEDIASCAERWPGYVASARAVGVAAVAGIPLGLAGPCVGAVNLYVASPRAWSERDLAAATVMANMATAYLINASLYDRERRLAEQLQEALDSRVVIEQAKGILAAERGIGVEEAFERIRRHARTHRLGVRAVAEAVVKVGLRPD